MKTMLLAATMLAASAANAEPVEYRVLFAGDDRGHFTIDRTADGIAVDYDYKQNGRGPTIKEAVRLGTDGLPVDWTITGRTTFGNAVDEYYRVAAGKVVWKDLSGPGTAPAPGHYITQNGSPLDTVLLAKALLAAPGHKLAVLPAGIATLTAKDSRSFDGGGGKVVATTYELAGLSLSPSYITLDDQGELFALPSSYLTMVRAGYEKGADKPLRDLTERLAASRLADLQKRFAHRYAGPVRIRNVRLFDPKAKSLTALSDVVVGGDRITAVSPAGAPIGAGETVVEGGGGTLIPGLADMHAHLDQSDALLNVLAGITSVRDMGNDNADLDKLVARIEKGEVAGPRVTRSGFIEGKSEFNAAATGITVTSEAEALDAVRWYAQRGFHQVKLYNSMKGEWAPAIVKEAHRLGLRVAGHVPAFSTADAMIDAGFNEITHVNQLMLGWVIKPEEDTRTLFRFKAMQRFPDLDLAGPKVSRTLDRMVELGTAHEPTLGIHELGLTALDGQVSPGAVDYVDHLPVSEQRGFKQAMFGADSPAERARYVAAYSKIVDTLAQMHRRGIMLIPGTDTGGAFTLHRELELFTKLGMTPADVLARDTLDMARYLGVDQRLGSIERGKLADFFLVPGDPTRDLKAIKTIALVSRGGTFYYPTEVYPSFGIRPFTELPKISAAR